MPRLPQAIPPSFSGSGAPGLQEWLSRITLSLEAAGARTDRSVAFAAQFLSGEAANWFRHQLSTTGQSPMSLSWQTFVDMLYARYQPIAPFTVAMSQLRQLKQHNFKDVGSYADAFDAIVQHIPRTDISERAKNRRPSRSRTTSF
jgi:hypothetical protein